MKYILFKKKHIKWITLPLILIGIIMILINSLQEKLIFFPEKIPSNYKYEFAFTDKFKEINYKPDKGVLINSLLFKSDKPKGLIFYLHGNAGSLKSWGNVAESFLKMNYDVLIIDYRGYGKSTGKISEKALYSDSIYIYNKI